LEQEYRDLNNEVEEIYKVMVTQRLDSLEEIDSADITAQKQLLTAIGEGDIPLEVSRLEQSLMMVGQQINSKTIATNSRMGIAISIVAAFMTVLSIFATIAF
jgi:hypothetical protein